MNTMSLSDRPADGVAGEPDDPSGSSSSEPRQPGGAQAGGAKRHGVSAQAAGVAIEIHDATARCSDDALAWLSCCASAAFDEALRQHGLVAAAAGDSVRVRIIGDAAMAEEHLRLCGQAGTTDVITVDLNRAETEAAGRVKRPMDADLLICFDEAVRQADERGHAVERELLLYILHGVLHCFGHDDHDDEAFAAMHAMEDAVLEAIGVGRVFAGDDDAASGARAAGGAS